MNEIVLDTSSNNPISQSDLKASGAVALIAKATEGGTWTDPKYTQQRQVAKNAGVVFGAYLFLRIFSPGSEAGNFLKFAKPIPGDLQPIIDAEVQDGGSWAQTAERVDRCAKALEAEGYRPLLYASSSFWQQLYAARPSLKRLRVWEAQYPGRFTKWFPRLAKLRIRLGHGVTVVMWQFTDSYDVNGKKYDASVLLASLDSITIPKEV